MAYLIHTSVLLAIFFLVYLLFLKREKSFQFNRFYLLVSVLLSIISPLVQFENKEINQLVNTHGALNFSLTDALTTHELNEVETIAYTNAAEKENQSEKWWILYYLIVSILLIRFLRNLLLLYHSIPKNYSSIGKLKLILLEEKIEPYSFFRFVFLNKSEYEQNKISQAVIEHEKVHGNQFHSVDIIFIELCSCFLWFNPIIWLYKKEISINHEYLADNEAINSSQNALSYSKEILKSSSKANPQALSCGFSYLQIKNRIKMLNQKKSSLFKIGLKLTVASSMLVAIFLFSSHKFAKKEIPFMVIIDAGHGGKDSGASHDAVLEKDITLKVIQQLNSMNNQPNLNFVFTRISDEMIDLNERIEFINSKNADLFISLHVNQTENQKVSGCEIFVANDSLQFSKSKASSDIMYESLASSNTFETVKMRKANFSLLKNVKHPSYFIELGYLSNENDLKMLTNEESLAEVSHSIYEGLINTMKKSNN